MADGVNVSLIKGNKTFANLDHLLNLHRVIPCLKVEVRQETELAQT